MWKVLIDHRLARKAGATESVAQGLGERGQGHRASLRLACLGGRKQELNGRHVGFVDARAVDLEPPLPTKTFADQVIDAADCSNAAVGGQSHKALRLGGIRRHLILGGLKFITATQEKFLLPTICPSG